MAHSTTIVKYELGYPKFDFHSLRHTHATELSEVGVNIKEIQRRLGHSTMEVTSKRYLHATKAMEDESVEKMNRMFAANEKAEYDETGAARCCSGLDFVKSRILGSVGELSFIGCASLVYGVEPVLSMYPVICRFAFRAYENFIATKLCFIGFLASIHGGFSAIRA